MNDTGKLALGLLAGLAAGAALGLLIAPEKGEDLRNKLNESLKSLSDDIRKQVSETVDNVSTQIKERKIRLTSDEQKLQEDYVA